MNSNSYMNEYMKARYHRRREEALVQLGGVCTSCGSDEYLEFHHVDPNEKNFTLAKGSSFSEQRWQTELDKCHLLCNDCHVDEHRSDAECGTPRKYWAGCKCDDCKRAYNEYNQEYRRRRRSTVDENP